MIGANVSAFSIGKAVGRGGGAGPFDLQYVVVAGGGGGSQARAGGGAGGLLQGTVQTELGVPLLVTIGAGGSFNATPIAGNTIFSSLTAIGGGKGAHINSAPATGGSGGGARSGGSPGLGTSGQGNRGGYATYAAPNYGGAGGGGAGGVGLNNGSDNAGRGGVGLNITLSPFSIGFLAGGGGGGTAHGGYGGQGGQGGGGYGGANYSPSSGTANTGGGGGAGAYYSPYSYGAANGGSGVIHLVYPDTLTATLTSGITSSTSVGGGFKKTKITSAGPADTVTFG